MTTEELCFQIDILMAEKEAQGIGPLHQVDMMDLIKAGVPPTGLLYKMRHLVKSGIYKGSTTVNGTPILIRKAT